MIQWRKFELKRSYINEFLNFLIFHNFLDFILIFQDLFNRAGPAEVTCDRLKVVVFLSPTNLIFIN